VQTSANANTYTHTLRKFTKQLKQSLST